MSAATDKFVAFVKRNPIGVGCGILSLALIGILYFRWGKIDEVTALRDDKDIQSHRLQENKVRQQDLKEQLDRLTDDNKAIETRLLSLTKGGATYVRYFFLLQDLPGVTVIDASPTGVPSKLPLGPMAFNVTVKGPYIQMMNVLRRMESGSYFCRINSVNISGVPVSDTQTDTDQLTMRFGIELLGQQ